MHVGPPKKLISATRRLCSYHFTAFLRPGDRPRAVPAQYTLDLGVCKRKDDAFVGGIMVPKASRVGPPDSYGGGARDTRGPFRPRCCSPIPAAIELTGTVVRRVAGHAAAGEGGRAKGRNARGFCGSPHLAELQRRQ